MSETTTIRTQLDNFMKQRGLNISRFGKMAGLNAGTMSSILNGNRVMAVNQLDRITAALELPDGYFYEQYIQEYLNEASPNWRRIKPFLYRCAELGKLDCIRNTVYLLMDKLVYTSLLFETAEDFFVQDRKEAAAILFESVASSEKNQHSERLALCQYRLFKLRQGNDLEQNYQSAIQFKSYIDRLDEADQLDALTDLADTYRSLNKWDEVIVISQKMEHLARIQYSLAQQESSKRRQASRKPKRPLFFYIVYPNWLRAGASDAKGDYHSALHYTYAYSDLSWVKEKDSETLRWIQLFTDWAKANTYVNKLLSGDIDILPDYLDYLEQHEEEILPALVNIMQAANRYGFNADDILTKYKLHIEEYAQGEKKAGIYTEKILCEYTVYLFSELAEYYLNKNNFSDGFNYLIECFERTIIINDKKYMLVCIGLFEKLRFFASSEIISSYQKIIREVYSNEKKTLQAVASS